MKFSINLKKALDLSMRLATQTGGLVCTEHLLYGLISVDGSASQSILHAYGVSSDYVLQVFKRRAMRSEVEMSSRATRALNGAKFVAEKIGSAEVGTEHLLYALTDDKESVAMQILISLGIDIDKFQRQIYELMVPQQQGGNAKKTKQVSFDDILHDFLNFAMGGVISPRDFEQANNVIDSDDNVNKNAGQQGIGANQQSANGRRDGGFGIRQKDDDEIGQFGEYLNDKAKAGKLDPVIGRGKEIERIIQILCRRTKNNPILIGEPGVGKTAIVDGLAQAIENGEVPDILRNKRIFSLDVASLVAGTRYRGDFEERFKNTLKSIQKDGNTILFIDEIHTILSAGSSEGGLDIANIIKPLLARGELQTIGATTIDEYRKYFEKDAALERRFQPIMVDQPTVSDTIEILQGLKEKYENHHKVEITDEAISAAAILSDRYITDRFLPDKAIDLIDEAASKKKIFNFTVPQEIRDLEDKIKQVELDKNEASRHEQYQKAQKLKAERDALLEEKERAEADWKVKCANMKLSIGEEEIADIVSNWTGIPVRRITEGESEKLARLESILSSRVIGQQEAVVAVSKAIRRARAGLKDPNRPIGSFIFLGPTGVGKTELTKALAEAMFGDENLMVRVDMSEYMEKENVSKLIGSAPGYVGYDEGGQLTEKVRRKPYSVVLFDEIEKAHPEIFNILLQILEDGRLTDSHGRTVSFKNTVIIMTSNIGASEIAKMRTPLGFQSADSAATVDYENMKTKQMAALKEAMKPELINRIDEIIIFRRLAKENIFDIAELMFKAVAKRLDDKDVTIKITDKAKEFIVSKGFDEEYGARPLRRTIQRLIEDKLSEQILSGEIGSGDNLEIDEENGELIFSKI